MNINKIIISESKRKNIRMVMYQNTAADGRRDSITRFEPIDEKRNCYKRFGRYFG